MPEYMQHGNFAHCWNLVELSQMWKSCWYSLYQRNTHHLEFWPKSGGIVIADKDFLLEVDLLAASLFFSNTSNELVHVAQTFIALSDRLCDIAFLCQLEDVGLNHTGKGKGKATMNVDDNDSSPPFLCFHLVMAGPCVVLSLCLVSSYMMLFDTS